MLFDKGETHVIFSWFTYICSLWLILHFSCHYIVIQLNIILLRYWSFGSNYIEIIWRRLLDLAHRGVMPSESVVLVVGCCHDTICNCQPSCTGACGNMYRLGCHLGWSKVNQEGVVGSDLPSVVINIEYFTTLHIHQLWQSWRPLCKQMHFFIIFSTLRFKVLYGYMSITFMICENL